MACIRGKLLHHRICLRSKRRKSYLLVIGRSTVLYDVFMNTRLGRKYPMHTCKSEIDRRTFLRLAGAGFGAAALGATANSLPSDEMEHPRSAFGIDPILHLETDASH